MNQLPTAQQKRILRLMLNGDLIWEVAGKSYRSIYNERLGRQQRIPASAIEEMERQGWIRRLENPNSSRLGRPSASVELQPPRCRVVRISSNEKEPFAYRNARNGNRYYGW